MVGGIGNRRDEGSLVINKTNVFAALETLRKKKKSDKDKLSNSKSTKSSSSKGSEQTQQQVFWAPAPLKVKSWADLDDDEDEDYYATTALPPLVWGKSAGQQEEEQIHEMNDNNVEDTESDEDILDEGDEEINEERENELDVEQPEPLINKTTEAAGVSVAAKEADKQLSKKEKKKKELAELEALLADFGVAPKESNCQDESCEALREKKDGEHNEEREKKDNAAGESKAAKKKKKKEKSSKETKDSQDHPNNLDTQNGAEENTEAKQTGEVESSINVKERLKKMASVKKKKPGKEVDSAARAAALEAATRNAKLAASKKKEKSHYNQQPVRLLDGAVGGIDRGRAEIVASLTSASRFLFNAKLEPVIQSGHVHIQGSVSLNFSANNNVEEGNIDTAKRDSSWTSAWAKGTPRVTLEEASEEKVSGGRNEDAWNVQLAEGLNWNVLDVGKVRVDADIKDGGMMLLTALSPYPNWLHGSADNVLQVRGTMELSVLDGSISFHRACIYPTVLRKSLTNLGGTLHVQSNRLCISSLESKGKGNYLLRLLMYYLGIELN